MTFLWYSFNNYQHFCYLIFTDAHYFIFLFWWWYYLLTLQSSLGPLAHTTQSTLATDSIHVFVLAFHVVVRFSHVLSYSRYDFCNCRLGLADGPMVIHWLGGRHWGLATVFPIGPSPKSLGSHIIWLPALPPKPHCSCSHLKYLYSSFSVALWR